MKKRLYNCAVLYHPKSDEEDTTILLLRLGVLAANEESAKIDILRDVPLNEITKVDPSNGLKVNRKVPYPADQLEVIVRPF